MPSIRTPTSVMTAFSVSAISVEVAAILATSSLDFTSGKGSCKLPCAKVLRRFSSATKGFEIPFAMEAPILEETRMDTIIITAMIMIKIRETTESVSAK